MSDLLTRLRRTADGFDCHADVKKDDARRLLAVIVAAVPIAGWMTSLPDARDLLVRDGDEALYPVFVTVGQIRTLTAAVAALEEK